MTITTANHSYSIAERLDQGLKCGMMLAVLATVGACGSGETPGPAETGGAQGVGGSGTHTATSATTSTSSAATGGSSQTTSNVGGASNVGGTNAVGGASAAVGGASTAVGGTSAAAGGTKAVGGASAAVGGTKAAGGASAAVGGTKAAGGASAAVGGASVAVGGASVAVGGASVAVGGASAANGGASAAVGGTKAAGGASAAVGGTKAAGGASAAVGGASAAVGGASTAGSSTTGGAGGSAGGTFVENEGADCTVTVPTSGSDAKLPDPFKKIDGTRIAAKADWRCRRQEIVKMAEATAYGPKTDKPTVTGTITETKITVNVSQGSKSASFSADIKKPSKGTKPWPVIVGFYSPMMPGYGIDETIVSNEGVAMIALDPTQVGGETGSSRSRSGAFFTVTGSNTTGTLMAWAWGVSRIIDLIEQSDGTVLKADAVGVTGCSRYGKGAFVAGAFDQRIALGIPVESGSGGAPIWRGIPGEGAQSLSSAYGEQPWLGDAFSKNTSNPAGYLIDTHEVVALYAPRGLLILDNPHIANLGPKSAHVAALGGAEVYKALGFADRIAYHSDTTVGEHCSIRTDYAQPLKDAIQRFLTKTGTAAGTIKSYSSTTGKLSDWATWTTPTLQ